MVYQTTKNLKLRYPQSGDNTRTWEHWQALAEDVDAQFPASKIYSEFRVTTDTLGPNQFWLLAGVTIPANEALPGLYQAVGMHSFNTKNSCYSRLVLNSAQLGPDQYANLTGLASAVSIVTTVSQFFRLMTPASTRVELWGGYSPDYFTVNVGSGLTVARIGP